MKRLKRRHADLADLKEVIRLVLEDTGEVYFVKLV